MHGDTIYALSTGGLPSGVAVVRLSGPDVRFVCETICGPVPLSRKAVLRSIQDRNGFVIDRGLVLFFSSPHSFTGEDCLEFHVHGSRAVVSKLLDTLGSFTGLRHAEAGEFTHRAFDNGKIDLVETEGLADLLAAETEMQRRLALEHANGGLTSVYEGWATRILHARAMIEAELDFADEGDVPGSVSDRMWADMALLLTDVQKTLSNLHLGEMIRDGMTVVIAGPPNAGKSSLLNALAGRDVAIVTHVAGTTRDVLSIDLDIDGFLVHLKDTAGLRETDDVVEIEGIKRASAAIQMADVVLHLVDLSDKGSQKFGGLPEAKKIIRVGSKLDLVSGDASIRDVDVAISTKAGTGIDSLMQRIVAGMKEELGSAIGSLPSRQRHASHLVKVQQGLEDALAAQSAPLEIRAEYLRQAADSLGRITGRTDVEMLLGVIFSEFCIGK